MRRAVNETKLRENYEEITKEKENNKGKILSMHR